MKANKKTAIVFIGLIKMLETGAFYTSGTHGHWKHRSIINFNTEI